MNKQLQNILLNIAQLPAADQRWILRNLPENSRKTLNRWQGLEFLLDAQRFPSRSKLEEHPSSAQPGLPGLDNKSPLYAAIVLEQGGFPKPDDVDDAIMNQVLAIKPLVKQAVFNEWETAVSFERLLGDMHG